MEGGFDLRDYLGKKPYFIFIKRYRNLTQQRREARAAEDASNNGKCWWVHQWMRGNPNRIKVKKDKHWLISI